MDLIKNVSFENNKQMYEAMSVKCISLADIEEEFKISSKKYFDWKSQNILYETEKSDERKKTMLNFYEYVWLRCIAELREFGIGYDKIQKGVESLKKEIDLNFSKEEIASIFPKLIKAFQKEKKSQKEIDIIIKSLSEEGLKNIISFAGKDFKLDYFKNLIHSCVFYRQEVGIIMYSDGTITPYLDEIKEKGFNPSFLFNKTFLYVSFRKIINDFISNKNYFVFVRLFNICTIEEFEILSFMNNEKGVSKLNIERRENYTLLTAEIGYNPDELYRIKQNLILKYPKLDIDEKRAEGKIKNFKVTIYHRIEK